MLLQKHFTLTSNPEYIFEPFINTRQIQRNSRLVLMPVIEVINHTPHGKA